MPGEERKFRRRRIMAFIPARKREREVAASQAANRDEDSLLGVGLVVAVPVGDGAGVEVAGSASAFVAVDDGSDVSEAGSLRGVDSVTVVPVADGRGVEVVRSAAESIAVDDGKDVGREVLETDSIVSVGDGIKGSVAVSAGDVAEVVIMIGSGRGVGEALNGAISAGGSSVETGDNGRSAGLRSRRMKRINRRMATVNLKRS